MPRRVLWLLPFLIASALFPQEKPLTSDETTLRAVGLSNDPAVLLDYFRKRTPGIDAEAVIAALINQLGAPSFALREQAQADLTRYGPSAVQALTAALKSPDLEIGSRAERCLRRIAESGSAVAVSIAAARELARVKAPGACEVLLAFLSPSGDPLVMDEVRLALAALAVRDGQPEPVLVAALTDKQSFRRAAAAEAILRAEAEALRPAVAKLLHDPEPAVRLRVGLALAAAGDKEAIPVLIELLTELPLEQAFPAEDLLLRLADEQAPPVALGRSGDPQAKIRDAWRAWWRSHASRVDLSKLREPRPERILVAQWDSGQQGRVLELDRQGKSLWQVDNVPWPLDAQLLPGNRLLLTEFYENRVTERNFKGEQLWHHAVGENPIAATRLPNGNTFIATRSTLLEVDRQGKQFYGHRIGHALLAAQKSRDGGFACITAEGSYLRLNPAGKEIRQFPVHAQNYCSFDLLPGGGVLVPQEGRNLVAEFSAEGKQVWSASVYRPVSAARLPNGHVLVASRDGKAVLELDVSGRNVREFKSTGYPWRARLR